VKSSPTALPFSELSSSVRAHFIGCVSLQYGFGAPPPLTGVVMCLPTAVTTSTSIPLKGILWPALFQSGQTTGG
jgi:hypothetical protein